MKVAVPSVTNSAVLILLATVSSASISSKKPFSPANAPDIAAEPALSWSEDGQLKLVLQRLLEPVVQRTAVWWQQPLMAELLRLQQDQQQLQKQLSQTASELLTQHQLLEERLNKTLAAATESVTEAPINNTGRSLDDECALRPTALPAEVQHAAPPAVRACARSCLQLRDQAGSPRLADGVYWLTGLPVPVYCDMSHDDGGWTLLLTAANHGWDVLSALARNETVPSLIGDYSILKYADRIRDLGTTNKFAYRIETQVETGRQQWGGIWTAPRAYSFVHTSASQTDVDLIRRFNTWNYKETGVKKRMPWLNIGGLASSHPALLTTMGTGDWWGSLLAQDFSRHHQHSPWIRPEAPESGTVLYWMREEAVDAVW